MRIWFVLSIATVSALPSTQAMALTARTCSEAVAKCQAEGPRHRDINEKCAAAGVQCVNTGVFVGPFTGRKWYFKNR